MEMRGPVITLACVLTLLVTTEHNKGVHPHPIADQRRSIGSAAGLWQNLDIFAKRKDHEVNMTQG